MDCMRFQIASQMGRNTCNCSSVTACALTTVKTDIDAHCMMSGKSYLPRNPRPMSLPLYICKVFHRDNS